MFVTNWLTQMNVLYVNDGRAASSTIARRLGLVRRVLRRPASAPPGSTTTTTPGWTSWPSTAACRYRSPGPREGSLPAEMRDQLYRNLRRRPLRGRVAARRCPVPARGRLPRRRIRRHRQRRRHRTLSWYGARPAQLLINNIGNRRPLARPAADGAGGRDMIGARVGVFAGRPALATGAVRRQLCVCQRSARAGRVGLESTGPVRGPCAMAGWQGRGVGRIRRSIAGSR